MIPTNEIKCFEVYFPNPHNLLHEKIGQQIGIMRYLTEFTSYVPHRYS